MRPDISHDVLELTVSNKHAIVDNVKQANKVVKHSKGTNIEIHFPCLGKPEGLRLAAFSDASYANLVDGVSSREGFIILLVGANGRCCPIVWCSKQIRRVVKSTLAAETLALVDCLDTALYLASIIKEVLSLKCLPVDCYTENKLHYENFLSTKLVAEKRLRIDIASVKQMIDRNEVKSINWLTADTQLADSLTKRGA